MTDIFDSLSNFATDPIFLNTKLITKHFIYSLLKNFNTIIRISEITIPENVTGGKLFNTLTVVNESNLVNDDELVNIANVFKASIGNSNLKTISQKMNDPIKHFLYFTKYLYVPVRLDYKTIPEDLQIKFCKVWLTTVLLLISNSNYFMKYTSFINKIDVYKQCLGTLLTNPDTRMKLLSFSYQQIEILLSTTPSQTNNLHIFMSVLNKLVATIHEEIIQKFCPNYNSCQYINKNYDGSWISPFDSDINLQLEQIRMK